LLPATQRGEEGGDNIIEEGGDNIIRETRV
jgi:hypothetical protein